MKKKKSFWLLYAAAFTSVYALVTFWFWSTGRSLNWEHDGLTQHYKAAVWYGEYLRDGIKALFTGLRPVFTHFNASVGEGADVFQAFHYYVLGDPFALFTVFFTRSSMYMYFYLTVFLRLFIAGAAFILFYREAFSDRQVSDAGLITGAVIYAFCDWSLYNLNRHVFFLNPLIYLPLLLLGTERILKKKKPAVFILAVFVSALSNLYFFYMLVLLTVAYVLIRLTVFYAGKRKEALAPFLIIAGSAILGVAMAAVVLLPVLGFFLRDERMAGSTVLYWHYPLQYYMRLPGFLIKPGNIYWTRLGFSPAVLVGILLFFQTGEWKKKESRTLLVCLIGSVILLIVPVFGQILNGFSYMSNRWTWAFALLCVCLFVRMWDRLRALTNKESIRLCCLFLVYMVLCGAATFLFDNREDFLCVAAAGAVGALFLGAGILEARKSRKLFVSAMVCFAFFGILLMAAELYSPYGAGYAKTSVKIGDLEKSIRKSQGGAAALAAKEEGITDFYRFSGEENYREWNTALLAGNSSTNYYWSISDGASSRYIDFFRTGEDFAFQTYGYHLKTIPTTLSAVRYFVTKQQDPQRLPYGFTYYGAVDTNPKKKGKEKDIYQVYENAYAVRAITTYDSFVEKETAEKLSTPGRAMTMLQSAITEEPVEGLSEGAAEESAIERPYILEPVGEKVSAEEGRVTTDKKKARIRLTFEPLAGCEPYLVIENLNFTNKKGKGGPTHLYLDVYANGQTRTITHNKPGTRYYRGVHDYTLCLANDSEGLDEVLITLPNAGTYTWDSMKILYLPMEDYPSLVEERMEDTKDADLTLGRDEIRVSLTVPENRLLCFAFPYSAGWKAFCDGKETKLYRTNIKNMGVMLSSGSHEVVLKYHTPYLTVGALLSILSWCGFILLLIILKRKQPCIR